MIGTFQFMSKPLYQIEPLTSDELGFFRQLFTSELAVTIRNVEVIASVKAKILGAREIKPLRPETPES